MCRAASHNPGSGHVTNRGDPTTRCGGQERRPRLERNEAMGQARTEQQAGLQLPLLHLHTTRPARSVNHPGYHSVRRILCPVTHMCL